MPKAYILQSTYDSFGRVVLPEVIEFIEGSMDPDEIFQPEKLLECLVDNHITLLEEAKEDGLF